MRLRLNPQIFEAAATASLLLGGLTATAQADQTVFGEDINTGGNFVRIAHPNADAAQNAFLSALTGIGTENFEGFAPDTPAPITLTFPGAGAATLSSGTVVSQTTGVNGNGQYPISGSQFLETDTNTGFIISFSQPVAAFGFYGVDVGDYGNQLTLTLVNGTSRTLTVPHTLGSNGNTSGSVLYFGVIADPGQEYRSVVFGNTGVGGDSFAFDDMTIGSRQQVTGSLTPEPGAIALLSSGLLVSAGFLRRRIRK